ncbi:major facilitator superfamily domain-containing protein [Xylariales sp. PMI_506]|nr:major facilitator superfamily domain-containing protein [Xylariales sp. PMI_506]
MQTIPTAQGDETSPLLGDHASSPSIISNNVSAPGTDSENGRVQSAEEFRAAGFIGVFVLLLIGIFIANADTSLVLATYGQITSEFDALESASWLLTGYMLAMCGAAPLYGKLSNIYGRKTMLLTSYTLFAAGCLVCGVAGNMSGVIVGRLISGAGGAGMSSVVSFLIADLVPLRHVASYRSYVNIIETMGRSCGGPLGGWLAETMGWRWSFLIQTPLTIIAFILVLFGLRVPQKDLPNSNIPQQPRLSRIDFPGAFFMCCFIITILLPLSIGGNQVPWGHPIIYVIVALAMIFGLTFVYIELRVAKEPIFPLTLLTRRDVVIPYLTLALQCLAQIILMFTIPLYFQVTISASASLAGSFLVPAVVGNTLGGLACGAYISRTARYKLPISAAAIVAMICHALMVLRWTGHTSSLDILYPFFGGMGTGIAQSAAFIATQTAVSAELMPMAVSGLFLCVSFGSLTGVSAASGMIRSVAGRLARTWLLEDGIEAGEVENIVSKALSDVSFVQHSTGRIRDIIINAYVSAARTNFGLSLACCAIALVLGLGLREKKLA